MLERLEKRAWELLEKEGGSSLSLYEGKVIAELLAPYHDRDLVGSPKQIAWASDIRQSLKRVLAETILQLEEEGGDLGSQLQSFWSEESASRWIDRRCIQTPRELVLQIKHERRG